MKTSEIAVMSVFVALVVLALVSAFRQARQQRNQMQEYALVRGWHFKLRDAQLVARLKSMNPGTVWTANNIAQSGSMWLFAAKSYIVNQKTSPDFGVACLVERSSPQVSAPVSVIRRVPLLEKMVSQRVADLGSDEFRRGWVAACSDPEVARRAVTNEVQWALVEHDAGPAFLLSVTLTANEVLVETPWARTPEEWDYLVRLTTRLSQAN